MSFTTLLTRPRIQRNVNMYTRTFTHTSCPNSPLFNASRSEPSVVQPRLRLIMFGKPGAGKGTLTSRLVAKYDILSISTGDLLRTHIQEGSEVGKMAEQIVQRGDLIGDELMLKVVGSKLESLKNKHWILDGFPRTQVQGRLLDEYLKSLSCPLTLVVNIDVPDDIILERIADRWVHLPSGRVYNLSYNRPKIPGRDDITGEALVKRPDDNPAVFANRLKQFYASTSPLLSYYSSGSTILRTVQGRTSDEIWPQLDAVVRRAVPSIQERKEVVAKKRLEDAVIAEEDISNTSKSNLRRTSRL